MHAASCYLEHLKISENPISSSGKSKPNIKNHSKTKGVIVYKHCTTSLVSFSLPSSWQRYHTKENIWRDLRSHSLLGRIESSWAKRFKLACECLQLGWVGNIHPSHYNSVQPQCNSNTSQDHSLTSRPSWQAHAFWAQFSMKIMIHDQLLYWPQTALIFWFWWMFLQSTLMIACESAIQWTCPFYFEDLVQNVGISVFVILKEAERAPTVSLQRLPASLKKRPTWLSLPILPEIHLLKSSLARTSEIIWHRPYVHCHPLVTYSPTLWHADANEPSTTWND